MTAEAAAASRQQPAEAAFSLVVLVLFCFFMNLIAVTYATMATTGSAALNKGENGTVL